MMDFIRDLFTKLDAKIGGYLNPILAKIAAFLESGRTTVIAVIMVFMAIVVLIGLFRWLRKAPKMFIFAVIVFGLVIGAWVISK
jgi:hypothetical protein